MWFFSSASDRPGDRVSCNHFIPCDARYGVGMMPSHIWQDLKCDWAGFEGDGGFAAVPADDGKQFAADFPDIRIAPLYDVVGLRQRSAESHDFIACHGGSLVAWITAVN